MNKLLFLLIFIFSSVSLHAYAKRVILASYSTKDRAESMLKTLPTLSPTLYKLAMQHDFDVKIKESGKYYILFAEVFRDREVLNTALKKIRKSFPGAYVSSYQYPEVEEVKKVVPKKKTNIVKPKEVTEKKALVSELENKQTLKENVKPAIIIKKETPKPKLQMQEQKKIVLDVKPSVSQEKSLLKKETVKAVVLKTAEKTQETALDRTKHIFLDYFEWSYLVILVIGLVILRYYIKFKKIYDEY